MGLNLHFNDSGEWIKIPKWCLFFISLGEKIGSDLDRRQKLNMVVTVPTKAYVAPFIGVGILLSHINKSSSNEIFEKHFKELKSLKKNTPVLYRRDSRVLKGLYSGVTNFQGEKHILVRTQSNKAGGLTYYVPKKDALNIQIAPEGNKELPKNQKGRKESVDFVFSDAVYGKKSRVFLKQSKPRICFIAGKEFEYEVKNEKFSIINKNIVGTLNDLLRIKQFQKKIDFYQSQYISIFSRKRNVELDITDETIVIYSGSSGYLKWKGKFDHLSSVIILDRSDTQFELAVTEINNLYILSNERTSVTIDLEDIPNGIELMYWVNEL